MTPDVRRAFVVTPHHPDRLRRPHGAGATSEADAFRHALTWNVFRSLELIAPSFWLRRLHLRLTGEPYLLAPQVMSVRLWHDLTLPPIQRIDGREADVLVDVVIETEHDVWTLLVPSSGAATLFEHAAHVVDAGGWLAGRRRHHCGVIERSADAGAGALLAERYARSRESARLRSAARGPAAPAAATWGALTWPDLAAVLADCAAAPSLPALDRTIAELAADWLRQAGIGSGY